MGDVSAAYKTMDDKHLGSRRTRTVLRTFMRRGKSLTPASSVSTEESRNFRDVRSEATLSA